VIESLGKFSKNLCDAEAMNMLSHRWKIFKDSACGV
jgi:hypothetical protein